MIILMKMMTMIEFKQSLAGLAVDFIHKITFKLYEFFGFNYAVRNGGNSSGGRANHGRKPLADVRLCGYLGRVHDRRLPSLVHPKLGRSHTSQLERRQSHVWYRDSTCGA